MRLDDVLNKLATNIENKRAKEEQDRASEERAVLEKKALELDATKFVQRYLRPIAERAIPRLKQMNLEPEFKDRTSYGKRLETSLPHREFFSLSFTSSTKPGNPGSPAKPRGTIIAYHECDSRKVGVYVELQCVAHVHQYKKFVRSVAFDEIDDDVAESMICDAIEHIG